MNRRVGWDLLRSIFVVMVVLYHSTYIGPSVYHQFWTRHVVFAHQIGASMLMVLSAYFVAATIGRQRGEGALARWWRARIARMVPPFVVATLAAWAALRFLAPPGMFHPSLYNLGTNLLMMWNWNGIRRWDYVDGSYWTIPLQLLAFSVAARIRGTRLGQGRGLRALMWAALLVPLASWPIRESWTPLYTSLVDGLGLYRWHLFVAGVAVWMVTTRRLGRRHGAVLLAACVMAHAVQIGELHPGGRFDVDWWSVLGVGVGIVAMVLVGGRSDPAAHLPAPVARAATWLARNSYGVFLVHQTLGYVLMLRLQETFGVGPGLQTVAMVVNGLALGWVMTRFVERPLSERLLRAWDRHAARREHRLAGVPVGTRWPGPFVPEVRAVVTLERDLLRSGVGPS